MTKPDPSTAAEMLEAIRAETRPDIAADLLAAIYQREHDDQFEEERGVIRAELRDLISAYVTGDPT